jgi:septal ring factor EnvC (AmiA/AmiB activator)
VAAPTLSDILLALARLEVKQDGLMSAIERLREETDVHWKKIADLESKIAVLESQRQPKIHWLTIVVGIVAVVAFGFAVLDRLFVNN